MGHRSDLGRGEINASLIPVLLTALNTCAHPRQILQEISVYRKIMMIYRDWKYNRHNDIPNWKEAAGMLWDVQENSIGDGYPRAEEVTREILRLVRRFPNDYGAAWEGVEHDLGFTCDVFDCDLLDSLLASHHGDVVRDAIALQPKYVPKVSEDSIDYVAADPMTFAHNVYNLHECIKECLKNAQDAKEVHNVLAIFSLITASIANFLQDLPSTPDPEHYHYSILASELETYWKTLITHPFANCSDSTKMILARSDFTTILGSIYVRGKYLARITPSLQLMPWVMHHSLIAVFCQASIQLPHKNMIVHVMCDWYGWDDFLAVAPTPQANFGLHFEFETIRYAIFENEEDGDQDDVAFAQGESEYHNDAGPGGAREWDDDDIDADVEQYIDPSSSSSSSSSSVDFDPDDFDPSELQDVQFEAVGPELRIEDYAIPSVTGDKDCLICLETLDRTTPARDATPMRVACGHVFHRACLNGLINGIEEYSHACPLCRVEICPPREKRPIVWVDRHGGEADDEAEEGGGQGGAENPVDPMDVDEAGGEVVFSAWGNMLDYDRIHW